MIGCQAVVVLAEVKQQEWGWEPMTDNAREPSRVDLLEWLLQVEALGAGEIILLSIDRDGRGVGMDLELIRSVSGLGLSIPVVASGGCGKPAHVLEGLEGGADAIACGSMFGYYYADQVESVEDREGNWEWCRNRVKPFPGAGIPQVKNYLLEKGRTVRI